MDSSFYSLIYILAGVAVYLIAKLLSDLSLKSKTLLIRSESKNRDKNVVVVDKEYLNRLIKATVKRNNLQYADKDVAFTLDEMGRTLANQEGLALAAPDIEDEIRYALKKCNIEVMLSDKFVAIGDRPRDRIFARKIYDSKIFGGPRAGFAQHQNQV